MTTGGRTSRTTLAAVAASAGVSVATVSKVFNDRQDVAPATRAKVAKLLAEHDYVGRRTTAGSPPRGAPAVELVIGELNVYAVEILQGVLDAGTAAGISVSVTVSDQGTRLVCPASSWSHDLAAAGRRAVIGVARALLPPHVTALSRSRLPLVVVDPIDLPRARVHSVGATNFTGGLAATDHLLGLGHRRIAYIGGTAGAMCDQARRQGFRAAMEAAGVPVPEEYVRPGQFRYEDGLAATAAVLDLPRPPTAVFAASDITAAGAVEAARARGLRVPQDLSVVGFDDTELARHGAPPLTTVRQPLREMGGVALRTALRLADGKESDSHHVELATELVVRASTAPPRGPGAI